MELQNQSLNVPELHKIRPSLDVEAHKCERVRRSWPQNQEAQNQDAISKFRAVQKCRAAGFEFLRTHQYLEDVVGRLSLDVDPVDLNDLVPDRDEAGPVGRAPVHHAGDQNPTVLLVSLDGGALEGRPSRGGKKHLNLK